jgi:hypothetical protein
MSVSDWINRAISRLLAKGAGRRPTSPAAAVHGTVERIRDAQGRRKSRDRLFGVQMFGEPPWDIMIELFIADCEGRQASIGDLCDSSLLERSTVMRWLQILEMENILTRTPNPHNILLSGSARAAMCRYFGEPEI